jgi:hypothetical protein
MTFSIFSQAAVVTATTLNVAIDGSKFKAVNIRAIVADWVGSLRQEELWGLDDPLFPATKVDGRKPAVRGGGTGPQALEQRRSNSNHPRRHLRRWGCRTSTRTASGRRGNRRWCYGGRSVDSRHA